MNRLAIVQALGTLHDPRAMTALQAAGNDPDSEVSITACGILANLGNAQAIAHLAKLARAGDDSADSALGELCNIQHPGVLPALIAFLHDPRIKRKDLLTDALIRMHDPRAEPALRKLLLDPDAAIRGAALSGLEESEDPRALADMAARLRDKVAKVRIAAIEALAAQPRRNLTTLLFPMLRDNDEEVVDAARESLLDVRHPDPRTTEMLLRLLAGKSTFDETWVAIDHLGKLKEERAVTPLLALTEPPVAKVGDYDPGWRDAAVRALGYIGDKRATPALLQAVARRSARRQ